MITWDDRFILKTIRSKEKKTLFSNVKSYEKYIEKNEKSLLTRIIGMYTMKIPGVTPIDIIIMENALYGVKPYRIYDLKGSLKGRTSLDSTIGPFKDLDFRRSKTYFYLEPSVI